MYQITVALILHFVGPTIFNHHSTDPGTIINQENELSTLVFNTFVFCQICKHFQLNHGLHEKLISISLLPAVNQLK